LAKRLALPLLAALSAACASGGPYRKYYHDIPGPAAARSGVCVDGPKIASGSAAELESQGFAAVGYASFNAAVPDPASDPDVLAQAAAVGACRVLLSSSRSGERSSGFGGSNRDVAVYEVSAIFFRKRPVH
jgi:hypothetical protein